MRLLKTFVVGMGFVIVAGIAVMAWGLAHHWGNLLTAPPSTVAAAPAARPATVDQNPAAIDVPTPDGMHFEQMATAGGAVLLRFSGAQGERIVVVDPASGHITATIVIPPAKQ